MTRFFKNIGIFIFLFFIANIVYLKCLDYDEQFLKTAEFSDFNNENFEILVGGFSLSMNGIDTKILKKNGFKTYNFSLGGANISSTKLMLEKYLLKNKAPRYFIYGVSNYYFNTFIKHKENIKQKYHPLVDYHFAQSDKFSINNIPVVKFKWIFKDLFKKIISNKHRFNVVDGQVQSTLKRIDNTVNDKKINLFASKYFNDKNVQDLSILCKENNIVLILVEMPTWKSHKHINKIEMSYSKEIGSYFIDYNSLASNNRLSIDDKNDWTSDNHLNVNGAIKLTEILIDDIKSKIMNSKP